MDFKSKLQEFVQKCGYIVPGYQTINEGMQHASKFRSNVTVGGITINGQSTYTRRKDAEQETAKIALAYFTEKIKGDVWSFVLENVQSSQFILNEFSSKVNLQPPAFTTNWLETGGAKVWVSFVVFNGTRYISQQAATKKEAINLAAHTTLLSIIGNPDQVNFGLILCQMINSKITDSSFPKME